MRLNVDYKQGRAECGMCVCVVAWWCLGRDQRGPSGPVQCHVSCSHCTSDGLLGFFVIIFLQQNTAIKLLCNEVVYLVGCDDLACLFCAIESCYYDYY